MMVAEIVHESTGWSVVVEDNGAVAYAYLRDAAGRIDADVWLYNVGAPPQHDEWRAADARGRMPFRNSARYCSDEQFEPLTSNGDVSARFACTPTGAIDSVEVLLRGRLHAVLAPGARPGRCRLARADGPLAKRLELA